MGAKPLGFSAGETVTEGLDGLRERLEEYRGLGAQFAKWRAVINIGDGIPTRNAIASNAHGLARYSALCQEAGIVPIVEPEVLMDGPVATHDIDTCYTVTEWTLKTVFQALYEAHVNLEQIVLKPNMVISGKNAAVQAGPNEVAEKTYRVLMECVPAAVPGIAFLSGGQSDEAATEHLSLINNVGPAPWRLSFSYGRALQHAALMAWQGKAENREAAQAAFAHRARMNSLATSGAWTPGSENT
jgi:fructose-bisphosphate aldolase class I